MSTLAAWPLLTLLAVLVGYSVLAVGVFLAPMMARLAREVWRARRERRESKFTVLEPYPVYLLHFRRVFLFFLLGPPILLAGAWVWVRIQ
jgi:hypothetical protein